MRLADGRGQRGAFIPDRQLNVIVTTRCGQTDARARLRTRGGVIKEKSREPDQSGADRSTHPANRLAR